MSMKLSQEQPAEVGVIGLGPIATGLVERLSAHGIQVAVWDQNETARGQVAARRLPRLSVPESLRELVDRVLRPRRLVMIVPGGAPREEVLDQPLFALAGGDCLVDAGDTCFKVTEVRQQAFESLGVALLGAGGVAAARRGASIALTLAHRIRVAVPVLAASLNYADGFHAYRTPQSLIQAERDALTHEGYPRRNASEP